MSVESVIDVLLGSLRRYPQLCRETNFIIGTGQRHRIIKLQPIVQSLGTHKIAALPALPALSGNTRKGKATWGKAFHRAGHDIITTLANLRTIELPSAKNHDRNREVSIKASCLVCAKHNYYLCQKSAMVRTKQAQSEKLPPTQAAANYNESQISSNDPE